MRKIIKDKKAFLRIVEAFIAVLLIMSVLFIIIARQNSQTTNEEEIIRLRKFILDKIGEDDNLRNEILSGNLDETIVFLNGTVPEWLNYHVQLCNVNDVCGLNISYEEYEGKEVYSDDIPIIANLTYAGNPVKFKLFLWKK